MLVRSQSRNHVLCFQFLGEKEGREVEEGVAGAATSFSSFTQRHLLLLLLLMFDLLTVVKGCCCGRAAGVFIFGDLSEKKQKVNLQIF